MIVEILHVMMHAYGCPCLQLSLFLVSFCFRSWTKKFIILITILVVGSIVGLAAAFIVWQVTIDDTILPIDGVFDHAAVSCDSPYCAAIGKYEVSY